MRGEALGEPGRKPLQRIGLADMGVVGNGRRAHPEPVKTAAPLPLRTWSVRRVQSSSTTIPGR